MELETIDFKELDIELDSDNDTAWLTESQIAEFYGVAQQNINYHIKRIYSDKELASDNSYKENLYQLPNGQKRKIGKYNLDMLLHIGYGVKSYKGVLLRQEVTRRLKGYPKSLDQATKLRTIANLTDMEQQEYRAAFGIISTWWRLAIKHATKLKVAPEHIVSFAINHLNGVVGMDFDLKRFLVADSCRFLTWFAQKEFPFL